MAGERSVAVRVQVRDVEEARRRLVSLGAEGEQALARIEAAGPRASASLGRMDQASAGARRSFRGLGSDIGLAARDIATGTASVESLSTSVALAATRFGLWGTVAAVAVTGGIALWQMMRDLGDETEDASDAAERMSDIQSALKRLTDDSTTSIRDQTAAVSQLGGAARETGIALLEAQASLQSAQLQQETATLRGTLDELEGLLLRREGIGQTLALPGEGVGAGAGGAVTQALLDALAAIQVAQARDDPGQLAASISRLVGEMDDPALVEFQERLARSSATIIDLTQNTDALDKALEDAGEGSIQTSKQIETATTSAARAAAQAAREAERLSRERERAADREIDKLKKMAAEIDRESARLGQGDERQAQQQAEATRRQLERDAQATEQLLMQPFENFLQSVQSSTADVFADILDGGVTTFEDIFSQAKQLAIRFGAEMAALAIFNPRTVTGLAGAAGGPISLSQPITGVTAGQPVGAGLFGGTTTLSQALAAGALGGVGGGLFGSFLGGHGALGGSLGGAAGAAGGAIFAGSALGTALFPGIGTVGGALIGGLLGGAGGGLLGSLFGGGGGEGKTTLSGHGGLGASFGTGKAGQAIAAVDAALLDLLNARQEQLVNEVLAGRSFHGRVKDSQVEQFAATQRVGPAAGALGFNVGAIAQGSAQQQIQNLQSALEVQRAIRELTEGSFSIQADDLALSFEDLVSKAKRFGISLEGVADAQDRVVKDLQRQQDAQLGALVAPFDQLLATIEAVERDARFIGLNPAEQFAQVRSEFAQIVSEAEAGSIAALNQFAGASQAFIGQAGQFGASPGLVDATRQVAEAAARIREQLVGARDEATRGFEAAIERSRRDNNDRLDTLIQVTRDALHRLERIERNTA